MNNNPLHEIYEELDNAQSESKRALFDTPLMKKRLSKKRQMEERLFLRAQSVHAEIPKFTYKAARFEEVWLLDSIGGLYESKWITDVLSKVKGGKEASVYLCAAGDSVADKLVAAKIYRPRTLRNLKNDQQYRQGRTDLDSEGKAVIKDGDLHAMAKRTAYGEELRHQSWISYEFVSMQKLFEAGADIPRPYTLASNALLMEYVGDESASAPTLNEMRLERREALALFERVIHNIDLLLKHEIIHGDLSAYNILYWDGQIKLIDFPQVVSPHTNPNAFAIFSRDVKRVCEYFAKQGVDSDPRRIARDLWAGYGYPEKESVPRSLIDADGMDDR